MRVWSIDDESFYETVSVLCSVELTRATSPFSGKVAFYSPLALAFEPSRAGAAGQERYKFHLL